MSPISHAAHATHLLKHGFEDRNDFSGSMKVGAGAAMAAAAAAAVLSAPVSVSLPAAAAGAAVLTRFISLRNR